MALTLKTSLFPPGGYTFTDDDGVRHQGSDLKSLVNNLTKYRARLQRPPGNPMAEVTEQICRRSPKLCVGSNDGTPVNVPAPFVPTTVAPRQTKRAGTALQPLSKPLRPGAGLGSPTCDMKHFAVLVADSIRDEVLYNVRHAIAKVPPALAAARLAICAACPGRVDWTVGCMPCQKSVSGFVKQVVGANALALGTENLACLGDARCLGIEAHRASNNKLTHPDVPITCWRRTR